MDLQLSLHWLAKPSGLPCQDLLDLESGSLEHLSMNRDAHVASILSLDGSGSGERRCGEKRGLWMAAKTASVSYARELSPEMLGAALASGEVEASFVPHIAHLLDEAPVAIVVLAVEEAAERGQIPPETVWRNVATLARSLAVHRRDLWT